jgi:lipoprotein NlpI
VKWIARSALLSLFIVVSGTTLAASQLDFENCFAGEPDLRITGCTQIINDRSESEGNRTAAYYSRGRAWHDKDQFDLAISDFNEAIRIDPRLAPAYNSRGIAWGSKGKLDLAVADFAEAIRLEPKYAEAYYNRAVAYNDHRDFDHAISDFTVAVTLDPKNAPGYLTGRGLGWFGKAELDLAITDLNEAVRLDPKFIIAYYGRGRVWRAKGDTRNAIADFTKVIELSPNFDAAFLDRGLTYLYAGDPANALADINQAGELYSKSVQNALWADIVRQRLGLGSRLEQASAKFNMVGWPAPVVRLFLGQSTPAAVLAAASNPEPNEQKLQVCAAYFYSGIIAFRQGEKENARRLYRLAANDCPQDSVEWYAANAELKQMGP